MGNTIDEDSSKKHNLKTIKDIRNDLVIMNDIYK